ncbi:MAG: hypothetical protein ACRCXC_12880 [Legionella sp.]
MQYLQKSRIIKRFLKERSEDPAQVVLKDDDLGPYDELSSLLDHIELHTDGLFDFDTLETDKRQWSELCDIIKYSSDFEKGSPPRLKEVRLQKANEGIQYTLNAHDIISLPQDDYYTRPTSVPTEDDLELNDLIASSRVKLYALTQMDPAATPFDPSHPLHTTNQIIHVQDEIIRLGDNNAEKEKMQKIKHFIGS